MKRSRNIKSLFFLLLWFLVAGGIGYAFNYARNDFLKNSKYEIKTGLEINSYDISLSIMDTNKVDVTETIVVATDKQEILKNDFEKKFPIWQVNYDMDGRLQHRRVSIKSLRSTDKFETSKQTNSEIIKIVGDAPGASGSHTYTLKYRYHMGRDKNIGQDILAFRLFDKNEGVKIDHINLSISFPEVDGSVHLFDGKHDITSIVKYNSKDNTIGISLDDYEIKDFLSLYVELPDNFFTSFTYNYNFVCIIVCGVIILLSLIVFSLWYVQYEKRRKKLKKIPHYAIDGLDVASIGYIGGENDLNKLTYGLLASLILKGFIDAKKEDGKLIVRKGMARFDAKVMSANERALFNQLFLSEKEVVVNKFNFQQVNNSISENIYDKLDKRFNKFENVKPILYLVGINIVLLLIWLVTFILFNDMEPVFEILYILTFIVPVLTTGFAIFVNRKFTYGFRLCTRVEKLREFYENAEKTDFDLLLFDDKDYYAKNIPYMFILGTSNSIINKFVKDKYKYLFDVEDNKLTQDVIK